VAEARELPSRPGCVPGVGVVLAAGRSERIRSITRGGSKALLRLGGLSLVERAVRILLAAGVKSVVVVVGHDAGPVAAVVDRLGRGRVRAVYAERWGDGNGASLAAVEGAVAGEALFVLLTADHVFGDGAIDRLLATGAPAVLVDTSPVRAAWDEGTRVRVVDGAVVAFGKHLDEPAIDCGAFLLPPVIFRCQAQAAAQGDHTLAGAVTGLAQERPLRAVALPGGCWRQDVDTVEDAGGRRGPARLAR
jgi:1L-myo-inositol 1-phosphate cytidylyltransferase / CDP-L-myo-inositol myo-inositolphosphotransferase